LKALARANSPILKAGQSQLADLKASQSQLAVSESQQEPILPISKAFRKSKSFSR
jgi:hypothetical protein